MMCDLANMARIAAYKLPKGDPHRAALLELAKHVKSVRDAVATVEEFVTFYMIQPQPTEAQ